MRWTGRDDDPNAKVQTADGEGQPIKKRTYVLNDEPNSLDLADAPASDHLARQQWLLERLAKLEWAFMANGMLVDDGDGADTHLARVIKAARLTVERAQPGTLKKLSKVAGEVLKEDDLITPGSDHRRGAMLLRVAEGILRHTKDASDLTELLTGQANGFFGPPPNGMPTIAVRHGKGFPELVKAINGALRRNLDDESKRPRAVVGALLRALGHKPQWVKKTFE